MITAVAAAPPIRPKQGVFDRSVHNSPFLNLDGELEEQSIINDYFGCTVWLSHSGSVAI
jgi:hypothetical protein